MKSNKFYVVWEGREKGIFDTWDKCYNQINQYPKAKYKSFKTEKLAKEAFNSPYEQFIGKNHFESELSIDQLKKIGTPIEDSIVVDGAHSSKSKEIEYQGIHFKSKKTLFKIGPLADGTSNIAEFLAIVHALAYCKKNNLTTPIYSDSRNAMSWVRDKEVRTEQYRNEKNKKVFELIDRAIIWLKENKYKNKILKWETKAWGENPADFGRK